ncbi:DUF317 domain-containing protein [Streptomyces sp. NPDC000618]|uniref:DUF317 domain-containing protein n=1 Tax=Streptomyces sp. NPDC000618 TaxID=3154265 RepID=UPI00331A0954
MTLPFRPGLDQRALLRPATFAPKTYICPCSPPGGDTRSRRTAPSTSAWGGPPDNPLWKSTFSSAVPASLVAAFASSLASTVPLACAVWSVPAEARLHLTLPEARTDSVGHKPGLPLSGAPSPATASRTNAGASAPSTGPMRLSGSGLPAGRRR